jgi:hypothetical protein
MEHETWHGMHVHNWSKRRGAACTYKNAALYSCPHTSKNVGLQTAENSRHIQTMLAMYTCSEAYLAAAKQVYNKKSSYILTPNHKDCLFWEFGCTTALTLNPLTPESNPSAQRCLTRYFTGDFASWTVHFVNICVKNQQIHQLFIQFINYVW